MSKIFEFDTAALEASAWYKNLPTQSSIIDALENGNPHDMEKLPVLVGSGVKPETIRLLKKMDLQVVEASLTNLASAPPKKQKEAAAILGMWHIGESFDRDEPKKQDVMLTHLARQTRLPTLSDHLAIKQRIKADPNLPRVIANRSITPIAVGHLRAVGFVVADLRFTKQVSMPDSILAKRSIESDLIVVTNARDTMARRDPGLTPPIAKFFDPSSPAGEWDKKKWGEHLKFAIDDFKGTMTGKTALDLRGVRMNYDPDGTLTTIVPFDESGAPGRTVTKRSYITLDS